MAVICVVAGVQQVEDLEEEKPEKLMKLVKELSASNFNSILVQEMDVMIPVNKDGHWLVQL